MYICPVCGYDKLHEMPYRQGCPSYEICSCCGFEFGFDDMDQKESFESYRKSWIDQGAKWFTPGKKPDNWDLNEQLKKVR